MVRGSPPNSCPIVARALELGVNLFRQCADYGDGLAETNLGIVLKALGRAADPHTKSKSRGKPA